MDWTQLALDDPRSGDDAADLAALRAMTVRVRIADPRLTYRGVYALFGPIEGEQVVAAVEASAVVPPRVKSWFQPSEGGVDVTDPGTGAVLGLMVDDGEMSAAQRDTIIGFGYRTQPKYPGINAGHLQAVRERT